MSDDEAKLSRRSLPLRVMRLVRGFSSQTVTGFAPCTMRWYRVAAEGGQQLLLLPRGSTGGADTPWSSRRISAHLGLHLGIQRVGVRVGLHASTLGSALWPRAPRTATRAPTTTTGGTPTGSRRAIELLERQGYRVVLEPAA